MQTAHLDCRLELLDFALLGMNSRKANFGKSSRGKTLGIEIPLTGDGNKLSLNILDPSSKKILY